jgi:hypothetical protein
VISSNLGIFSELRRTSCPAFHALARLRRAASLGRFTSIADPFVRRHKQPECAKSRRRPASASPDQLISVHANKAPGPAFPF